MKAITKYINEGILNEGILNEGFFNNVGANGANYLDIILEWIIDVGTKLDGYISTKNKTSLLKNLDIITLRNIFTLDKDNKLSTNSSGLIIKLFIDPSLLDSMPDILYFSDKIELGLSLIDFKGPDFPKLEKLKTKLSGNMHDLFLNRCAIKDFSFLGTSSVITDIRINQSFIGSFNGLEKINSIYNITLENTTGSKNFMTTLPPIANSLSIKKCDSIEDMSEIAKSTQRVEKIFMYENHNIQKCDLSKLNYVETIVGDDNLFTMTENLNYLPKRLKSIVFSNVRNIRVLEQTVKSLREKFPSLRITATQLRK